MKKLSLVLITAGFVLGCNQVSTVTVKPEEEKKIKEVGESVSIKLLKTLKGELISSMQQGGPNQAVEVCSKKALFLTNQIEKETGYSVKRTSFKYRNPVNAPDKYETEALKYFQEAASKGNLPKYYIQGINENGKIVYIYYKPLKVEGVCLTCHGDPQLMDRNLVNKIKTLYPNDKAIGYKEGDFRGVVRVKIPSDKL